MKTTNKYKNKKVLNLYNNQKLLSLPNLITLSRIVLSIGLLFIEKYCLLFLTVYSICGFTDILDGYIARKTKTESKFGARLDSTSDLIFCGIMFIIMFDVLLNHIALIIIISTVRILSFIIVIKKFNEFTFLHTYLNKLTGLLLFLSPFFMNFVDANKAMNFIGGIAFISAIEELLIVIESKRLDLNKKSLFN